MVVNLVKANLSTDSIIWLSCRARSLSILPSRYFTTSRRLPLPAEDGTKEEQAKTKDGDAQPKGGRLSERLAQMTEENLESSGRRASKIVEEAGFSDKLKERLIAKIAVANVEPEHAAAAAALINAPSSAGEGSRMHAAAQPWKGTEQLGDAALRMLNDGHKPLRGSRVPKIPQPRLSVDQRMRKAARQSQGQRLVNARDRTSAYALSQDPNLSEQEKEDYRKQLKERFSGAARPMPTSVQGLEALANERIEDAIARGQFKNIPRGKGTNTERDYTASSPFLDTTEYFMNKMIKKQDIVPPWIEKQQELVKEALNFRSRLRKDWKRHASRVIASQGGSLESQVSKAEAYAKAEADMNPKAAKAEAISGFDAEGNISQVTMTETAASPERDEDVQILVSEELAKDAPSMAHDPTPATPTPVDTGPRLGVFRDPDWERLEHSYHSLSIANLNSMTRSYNLQAPDLAKKPYFSLARELKSCFADVAPQLAAEIEERARKPEKVRVEIIGHRLGGVLERFGGEQATVYDERKPQYGFKEFVRDLWRKDKVNA